jgi:hypothetical protein
MSEISEDLTDEYNTVRDYKEIPKKAIIPPYLVGELWEHQYKCIYAGLRAENAEPVINDKGEVFYSRIGLVALGTGTGKTRILLGISNYTVDVNKGDLERSISSSSLSTVILNKKKRQNIDVTIICSDERIIDDAWIRDINQAYPGLSYYKFDTIGKFKEKVSNSQEYKAIERQYYDNIRYLEYCNNELRSGRYSQSDFTTALGSTYEVKNLADSENKIEELKHDLDTILKNMVNLKIFEKLSSVKIVFITKTSFHLLFDLFKSYTVSRLIFDDPQTLTLSKQKDFRDYLQDNRISKLRKKGMGRMIPYAEESPARFIWYVTATPNLIEDNNDNHYIMSWISKNDYVISDYAQNKEEDRMFPELVNRYVIKLPLSYILECKPGFNELYTKITLKCRTKEEVKILASVVNEDVRQMLENDDFEGAIKKLSADGSATNILDAVRQNLQKEIREHEKRIREYDSRTNATIREKSNEQLKEKKEALRKLNFDIERINSASEKDCPICYEKMKFDSKDPKEKCCIHTKCSNVFHLNCIKELLPTPTGNFCPMCREIFIPDTDLKIIDGIVPSTSVGSVIGRDDFRGLDEEKIYSSKSEALKDCLKFKVLGEKGYYRMKVLLFVQFANESNSISDIIKLIQNSGFNVRLPFNGGKKAELEAQYPTIRGCSVYNPKSKIENDIEEFKTTDKPFVWIFRSTKESAGLNFEFIDTLIQYSIFPSSKQIIGRALRMNRTTHVDLITLVNI